MAKVLDTLLAAMTKSRRGLRDTTLAGASQAAVLLSGLFSAMLIARGLGAAELGRYALVLSVAALASAISDLGVGQTALRFGARAQALGDETQMFAALRWALRTRLAILAAICLPLFFAAPGIAAALWSDPDLAPLLRCSLIISVANALAAVPALYFQSTRRFGPFGIANSAQPVATALALGALALFGRWTLQEAVWTTVAASCAASLLLLVTVPASAFVSKSAAALQGSRRIFGWHAPAGPDDAPSNTLDDTRQGTFALYMLISSVAVTLLTRSDIWLLGMFVPKVEVGIYTVAMRVTLPMAVGLSALSAALWPRAAALDSLAAARGLARRTWKVSVLGAAVAAVYAAGAAHLIPLFFGAEYAAGIFLSQLLCARYVVAILVCPVGVVGYGVGMARHYWWINLIQLVAVVGAMAILVPQIGTFGAALALILNELIAACFILLLLRKRLSRPPEDHV